MIFTTKNDARTYVIQAIENGDANAAEFNIGQIVDACFTYDPAPDRVQNAGFILAVDNAEFWQAVEAAAYDDFPAKFEDFAEDETDDNGPTGRTLLTLSVGVDDDEGDNVEIARLTYVTNNPESSEDLGELRVQLAEQGWKIVAAPDAVGGAYRVARI